MSSTVNRKSVDVASPERARPGLALILALLAIPGSTIAWELPSGGFWIGLPLALAAIVLGVRARRSLAGAPGTRMATAAVGIAILPIAMMVVWTLVEALG